MSVTLKAHYLLALLALPLLTACLGGASRAPARPDEHVRNGDFEQGLDGWTPSKRPSDNPAIDVHVPVVNADAARNQGQGVHCETPPHSASISALEQEITPVGVFTLDFWVRPQQGSNRMGLHGDGSLGRVNVSRLVFLDAGTPSAAIVFTAWNMNAVQRIALPKGTWLHVQVAVDATNGTQTLRLNDKSVVTLVSQRRDWPNMVVFGDRQPRTDVYTMAGTDAKVTDGLNGSYDYDDLSLRDAQ